MESKFEEIRELLNKVHERNKDLALLNNHYQNALNNCERNELKLHDEISFLECEIFYLKDKIRLLEQSNDKLGEAFDFVLTDLDDSTSSSQELSDFLIPNKKAPESYNEEEEEEEEEDDYETSIKEESESWGLEYHKHRSNFDIQLF